MPVRAVPLVNNEYYHIFNRSISALLLFNNKRDYERFLLCLNYYRYDNLPCKLSKLLQISLEDRVKIWENIERSNDKIVELIVYCLMPNHFHFLIKQLKDGGISKFLKQIEDSYTRFLNTKNDRYGPIFQGSFKAVHVENDEQLLHLSRYIHLNPLTSFVVGKDKFLSYPWSSLHYYLKDSQEIISTRPILENFPTVGHYVEFIMDQASYAQEVQLMKHLLIEEK